MRGRRRLSTALGASRRFMRLGAAQVACSVRTTSRPTACGSYKSMRRPARRYRRRRITRRVPAAGEAPVLLFRPCYRFSSRVGVFIDKSFNKRKDHVDEILVGFAIDALTEIVPDDDVGTRFANVEA